jgi:hypothetical protein
MRSLIAVWVASVLLAMPVAKAHDASTHAQARDPSTHEQAAGEQPDEDIGEVMAAQQMRHIKLWFAGRGGNWPLAEYEIDKLKEGFAAVNNLLGGDTVQQAVGAPIAALEKAVEAKDREAFARSFDQLSAGCSSCHRLLDHAFIVIKRPSLQPYSNQSFEPGK